MFLRPFLLVALSLATSLACADDPPPPFGDNPAPFEGKPEVASRIHVDNPAQWRGRAPVLLHAPDERDFNERKRLGTVTLAPGLDVDVETEDNMHHFPVYFELVKTGTQGAARKVLLRLPVIQFETTQWYFPGNGFVYANAMQWRLCGPYTTRKFALGNGVLAEVPQPLVAIDAPTQVETTTPLYDAPDGRKVVATVTKGTRVQVVGLKFDPFDDVDTTAALLVRTPLGLMGWHRREIGRPDSDGTLSIYQCN